MSFPKCFKIVMIFKNNILTTFPAVKFKTAPKIDKEKKIQAMENRNRPFM